jgi:adenosylhomocysteinase
VRDIIRGKHFEAMKDGAVVCNTGHYDVEINIGELDKLAKGKREIRPNNEEYTLKDGRRVYLLAQGRLVNLAAAEGHPSEVMDMSFANQFLALCALAQAKQHGRKLENKVYELPAEQDQELALLKLSTMGMAIDKLTDEQIKYAGDYSAGT